MKAKNVLILLLLVFFLVACAAQPGSESGSNQGSGDNQIELIGRTAGAYKIYRLEDRAGGFLVTCWIVEPPSARGQTPAAISCLR